MNKNDWPAMLKDNLYKYSKKCGLSNRLQIKSKLIIELLEKCPIDLNDDKKFNKKLLDNYLSTHSIRLKFDT